MENTLKAEGNKAFAAKDYDLAIDLFSKALDSDQNNFVLWSNRSAAKAGKRDWDGALADAEQVRMCLSVLCDLTQHTELGPPVSHPASSASR